MRRSIQLILFISFGFMISQCSIQHKTANNETVVEENNVSNQDSFELSFNIFPKEITYKFDRGRKLKQEIFAELILTNLKKKNIETHKTIFYGLKSEGDSYIEALDFDGEKITVERDMHYQYLFFEENFKVINIEPNQSKTDTIDLDTFYVFKKGNYKIRYVDTDLNIFSNWDTLKVN